MLVSAFTKRNEVEAREASLRAAIPAAAIVNVHRKKGARPVKPKDFFAEPVRIVSGEEAFRLLKGHLDKAADSNQSRVRRDEGGLGA